MRPAASTPDPPTVGPPADLVDELQAVGVRLEFSRRRADVVLAAPQRRNAQTPRMWRALAAVGEWLPGRTRVVVLRAEGPSFSAGLDRRAFTPAGLPDEPGPVELAALDDAALDLSLIHI